MKNSIQSEKDKPSYMIVSIALVQSEIYWFCSVLYCVFRESGLLIEQAAVSSTKRNRSISAPPTTNSFKNSEFVSLKPLNEKNEEIIPNYRRYSLPIIVENLKTEETVHIPQAMNIEEVIEEMETVNIRPRPTIEDEQLGKTCPPVIWQKLRVKLGHAPVHGDPKPKSIRSLSSSYSTLARPTISSGALSHSNMSINRIDSVNHSKTLVESSYTSPSLSETDSRSPPSSIFSFSQSSTYSSIENVSLNTQKLSTKRKIISKINSAFHLRKSRSSSDLKSNINVI